MEQRCPFRLKKAVSIITDRFFCYRVDIKNNRRLTGGYKMQLRMGNNRSIIRIPIQR